MNKIIIMKIIKEIKNTSIRLKYFFLLIFLSIGSCTNESMLDENFSSISGIKLAPEGYLIFDSMDSFIAQISKSPEELPAEFVSLNQIIRNLKADFQVSQDVRDLGGFYKKKDGVLLPHYPYMAFTPLLDKNMIVRIEDKLLKFDFDFVKESDTRIYSELLANRNVKKIPSQSGYSFPSRQTRSSTTCIGYLQISQLYNVAYGYYIADDMGHPDPVHGNFRADGGSLHYPGNSQLYGQFHHNFSDELNNPYSFSPVSLVLPCSDVYVTFTSYSGQIEFTSYGYGQHVNCDFNGTPMSTGRTMNGCN